MNEEIIDLTCKNSDEIIKQLGNIAEEIIKEINK